MDPKLNQALNNTLKRLSDFLVHRKGLPVFIGAGLAIVSLILNLLPPFPVVGWLAQTQLLLHLGVIIGLIGVLIGDAL